MNMFQTWQFNLIAYLVTIVIFNQFYRLAVKKSIRDGAATILLQIIATISVLFLIPLFEMKFPTSPKFYVLIVLASIFYAINDRLQTTVRKHLPVSEFTILSQTSRIFLFFYGTLLFSEPFLLNKTLGLALVLMANVVLVYEGGKVVLNKHVWLTLVAMLAFATAISIDVDISGHFNLPIYVAITLALPAFFVALLEKINIRKIADEFQRPVRGYYLVTGISWAFAIIFSLKAYQLGAITTQIPIRGSVVLANVLVAYMFFGEKDNIKKKLVAALLIIIGVYITVI